MSEQRSLSMYEYEVLYDFASDKYEYIESGKEESDKRMQAIHDFIGTYINGGTFAVFNARNQFLADFDVLDDAIAYKDENEPKNEIWSIEIIDNAE